MYASSAPFGALTQLSLIEQAFVTVEFSHMLSAKLEESLDISFLSGVNRNGYHGLNNRLDPSKL